MFNFKCNSIELHFFYYKQFVIYLLIIIYYLLFCFLLLITHFSLLIEFCPARLMDKPSDYGSDIRGSNPLRGTNYHKYKAVTILRVTI